VIKIVNKMTNLDINLQNKKLLIIKIVIIMNKKYNWSLNWFLKFSYQDFSNQKKLITKH